MHIRRAGDDGLGPANDDTVGAAFLDVEIDIGIGLGARPLGPVALGIGHGDAQRQILGLDMLEIGLEALMIRAGRFLIGK